MSKHAANDDNLPEDHETTEDSIEQEVDGEDTFLPVAVPTTGPAPAP